MTVTAGPEALATRLDTTDPVAAAVRAVPREHFLPARIWVQEIDDGAYEPIDRATEPARWMHDVYVADYAIVTQFDDGATPWPERGWRPSCSASQPCVVVGMLEALTVERGQRVLEIGTGTGYNAALLAELVGPRGHVLTVDVDGALVSAARKNLAAAGYQDRVEVGLADGATALAAAGSVDRVIATVAVQLGRLPYAWVQQTRPGGIILAPVRAELASGPLVCLEVGSDGTARGQAVGMRVGFMELRAQRTPGASWSALRWDDPSVEPVLTGVDPFTALLDEASRWAIAVSVPSCRYDLEKRTSERGHGVARHRHSRPSSAGWPTSARTRMVCVVDVATEHCPPIGRERGRRPPGVARSRVGTVTDRLLVDLGADGRVSVSTWPDGELPSPAEEPFEFVWPLDADALEDLRWYLEDYLRAPFGVYGERGPQIAGRLTDWGQAVFAAVLGCREGSCHQAQVRRIALGQTPTS